MKRSRQLGEAIDVPCNGCTACCYHGVIDVHPELEDPEHLAHLQLVPGPDGDMMLAKREDGGCVHLGPQGCTVWQYRPIACQAYDCRLSSLAGVAYQHRTPNAPVREPIWRFEARTLQDHAILRTLRRLVEEYRQQHPQEDDGLSAGPVHYAVENLQHSLLTTLAALEQAHKAWKQLPPALRAEYTRQQQ